MNNPDPHLSDGADDPSAAEVLRTGDSDLRAHRVSLAYYRIGHELSQLLNVGLNADPRRVDLATDDGYRNPTNAPLSANWFHFATWATRTLEGNISPSGLPGRFAGPAALRRAVTPMVLAARSAGDQRVGRSLVWGQLQVLVSTIPPARALLDRMREQAEAYGDAPPSTPPNRFEYDGWDAVWATAGHDAGPVRDAVQASLTESFNAYLVAQWHAHHAARVEALLEDEEPKRDGRERAVQEADEALAAHDADTTLRDLERQVAEAEAEAPNENGSTAGSSDKPAGEGPARSELVARCRDARKAIDDADEALQQLRTEAEGRRRRAAQHVLLANCLITAVEQTRVDETVTEVLDYWPGRSMDRLEQTVARFVTRSQGLPLPIATLGVANQMAPAREAVRDLWAKIMTDQVLVLSFPGETLRLGRDVGPAQPGQRLIPDALTRSSIQETVDAATGTDDPDRNLATLVSLLETLDRSTEDGEGSGARDWRRFADRMAWAVVMLRARQFAWPVHWPPYRREDEDRIDAGQLPLHDRGAYAVDVPAPFGRPEKRSMR